jgi:tRNA threonylcarbamoyl adenosine modification protein YjeE
VAATNRVAEELARLAVPGQVVVLVGQLGAGKTTFTKAYARALGVTATVTSPTFTLVHQYRCGPTAPIGLLLHLDLWRLEHASELDDLALDELLDEGAAAIVEWGNRFDVAGDHPRIEVAFHVVDDTTRELAVDLATAGADAGAHERIDS